MQIDLSKGSMTPGLVPNGALYVNVDWDVPPSGRGVDVDLACLYDVQGGKSVVQALGGNFGHFDRVPYVQLNRDDRTGARTGETMRVNLGATAQINRLLFFAYIYSGEDSWETLNARATVVTPDGPEYSLEIASPIPGATHFAIALFEQNSAGTKLRVCNVEEYFSSHRDVDRRFGWGLNWRSARK